jgi:hypothetical protein
VGRARQHDFPPIAPNWPMALSPPGAHIAPYNENVNIEHIHTDTTWDNIINPDGS